MSKKTRYFVMGAVAFLVVGLTTGLVASIMGLSVPVLSRAAGPDELQYVPANAAVVAYANVREVMNSDFRQRFRKLEPDTSERDEFQQKTGINIEEDIDSVVAAVMPRTAGANSWSPEGSVIVLARGRFEQSRLEALALEHGGRVEDYNGKRILAHDEARNGHTEFAVAFLDADLVGVGSYGAIKAAIDASTGANIVSNTEMMQQINAMDTSNAWAVGRFDAIASGARLPNEISAQIPAIQWFSAAGHINGGVSGVFKAETRDEEAANNLRDVVRGFVALARMQAGSRPELKGIVDSLQLSGDGRTVSVAFSVPSEVFDALESMRQQMHQQQQRERR
jgi:hypothetical protein